ncbi:MAG: DoxX family protein [Flavobacterium sp.]
MNRTFILRFAVAVILFVHGLGGMFNGGVNDFGNLYLNAVGFAPIGVILAWLIKISHVVAAVLLLMNRYIKLASIVTIFILIIGIFMVHLSEGWFVVGGGRNGVEFNFLLIFALVAIMFPDGISFNQSKK